MKKQSGWTKINRLYMVLFIWVFVSPAMANYQSQEGRWMQQDPLGVNPTGGKLNPYVPPKQYKDGLNIYGYCKSNPIHYNDPYGLFWGGFWEDLWEDIVGKVGPYEDIDKNSLHIPRYYLPTQCLCFCPESVTVNGNTFLEETSIGAKFTVTLAGSWKKWKRGKWSDGRARFQWWEWFTTPVQYCSAKQIMDTGKEGLR